MPPVEVRVVRTPIDPFNFVLIQNLKNESLGRITDLGVDLVNGRIVEALVVCDSSLGVGNKIVAVPPLALRQDPANKIYRLDVSVAEFKTAPAIDLSKWLDSGRSDRVAAAYRLFGQEPYFLEEGGAAVQAGGPSRVQLGYVERVTRIMEMPVGSPTNQQFGKVWGLTLDIPKGQILTVIILTAGNFETKSIVSPTALSFNPTRDALLLGDSKTEFLDEPRYILTKAAFGQKAYAEVESSGTPGSPVMLQQGGSDSDMSMTIRIENNIRGEKIADRYLQVGTIDGRVTLGGWVGTEEDKSRVGKIAIAAANGDHVDNEIMIGTPGVEN